MDPGTWGWHERRNPIRIPIEEVISNDPTQINLKIGQRFAHPLYQYRMQIMKIEVYKDDFEKRPTYYDNAFIFAKPYFQKESNSIIELGEYEIRPKDINDGKWFLIK
ncbi:MULTISPECIES: hypothetical protein [Bacillus cereus group]|uniref:hypothetical protein n=1 Tax=Bacillus cereus group TaxID=86661 RepID=UPI000451C8BC|nr:MULTISPECIES: hypothetical protein [Bacillus cereus group]ANT40138.1 hypothetical protein BMBtpLA4_44 [Bacillus phage vB_BtS_BMBtp15]EXY09358.1 hypothetical protein BF15_27760 [Bacillus thuringiensis]MEB8632445.1 hypothetical protein [Bacillus cereus]MEB8741377.1 hypothetical protein [Bacillus cereus]MEB8773126.1 hypothetical protein [Bacillus cereus]